MKNLLKLTCIILILFTICFPFFYYNSDMDIKEVKSSHILVKTEQEAKDIKKQIDEGKSFEEMAEKFSLCPSKDNKGDLGHNIVGTLLPEYEKAVYKLPLTKVSEPFKTSAGWHIAKVTHIKYYSDSENFERKFSLDKRQINKLLNK